MHASILTREYPPSVYGGAGVHVAQLVPRLRDLIDVDVQCMGEPRDGVVAHAEDFPPGANTALRVLGADLSMVSALPDDTDLVHSHTWYANMAGHLGGLFRSIPHVVTAHSLEPLRPWKREQLGGGYELSSWAERTAYEGASAIIGVSTAMAGDILRCYPDLDPDKIHVVRNGVDVTEFYPTEDHDFCDRIGMDTSRPSVVFVGRITRQKGLPHLLRAVEKLPADIQVVLCAGAPDTPEIMAEVREAFASLDRERGNIVWIEEMLPRPELNALEHGCDAFICPSIYEPLGIVNLEAMACSLPVVGSATGGIPEVVADGETGLLIHFDQLRDGTGTPTDPDKFVHDMAAAIDDMFSDMDRAREMGRAGYRRAQEVFSWETIADNTIDVYEKVLHG